MPVEGEGGRRHGHPGARLAWSAAIFGLSALIQGAGGLWTGSLGLVSDSLENLNDVLVNLLGLASLLIANRREPSSRYSFGWHRLEVFNMLVGVAMLAGLGIAVIFEALHRFRHPMAIQTSWVLAFSGLGLLLNVAAARVLRPRHAVGLEDASLRTAYTHAFADSLTSIGLVLSMILIRYTGWRWLDPLIALVILGVIFRGAFQLGREAVGILMHRSAFDHEAARKRLMTLPGVVGVEDFRSWRACSHLAVATLHVQVTMERLEETGATLCAIEHLLGEEFGVRHVTVHFETESMARLHHHRFLHRHEVSEGGHAHHHD